MNTTPSRYPSRGTTDREALYTILDEGLYCTVAFVRNGIPHQIPTGFAREGDNMYIHASSKSGFFDTIIGSQVSYSVTHLDALVLAPTALDHSFNYRSVIGFAVAEEVIDPAEKLRLFNVFTDRYIPGRIADVGEPTSEQVAITKIIRLSLDNAGAKTRAGDVNVNLKSDASWCGIIPVQQKYGTPEIDHQLDAKMSLPDYLKKLIKDE